MFRFALTAAVTVTGLLGSAAPCQAQNRIPDPPRQTAPPAPARKPTPRTLPLKDASPQAIEAAQQAAVEVVGQASEWPAAIRNFWNERASETLSINGVMWSVRLQQAGQKQADAAQRWEAAGSRRAGNAPSPADLAGAYEAADAPLYIRLSDGATATTLEAAAGMADGLEVITGTAGTLKDSWANFRANRRNYLLAQVPDEVRGAMLDHKGEFTLVVRPDKEVEQTSAAGRKSLVRSYRVEPVEARTPTAEELRAWCRQHSVTAFPDPRPVPQAVDTPRKVPPSPQTDWKVKTVADRSYTFTWSNHTIPVFTAAR